MALLTRNEFARLFNKIMRKYLEILKSKEIDLPISKGATWGIGDDLEVFNPTL